MVIYGKECWKVDGKAGGIEQALSFSEIQGLRYSAFAVIAAVIALQISMIIWMDDIPLKTMLFMRGCVGTSAIIFVVLVGILTYRANNDYIRTCKRMKKR